MKFVGATTKTQPHGLSNELLKTTSIKGIKSKVWKAEYQSLKSIYKKFGTYSAWLLIQLIKWLINVCLLCFVYAHMIRNITSTELMYCFFAPDLRSFQVVPCLLQVVSGRFLITVGCFMSFLARSSLFQVVSGHFLLVVVRFRLFLVVLGRFRSFQTLVTTFWKLIRK